MQKKLITPIVAALLVMSCSKKMPEAQNSGHVQLKYISLTVEDQAKALGFYTSVLGFQKQADVPVGEHRWLTVVSPGGIDGVELLFEPAAFAPAKTYQKALFDAGIPATTFVSMNLSTDFDRLRALGVIFRMEPMEAGNVKIAIFEDTCGNLIQLTQVLEK
jgi:catechol 2,3-dioxygenase-like lactoylglutathione lyase family enzyme